MRIFFIVILTVSLIIAARVFSEGEFEYDGKGKRDPFVPLVSDEGVYVSDAYGIRGIRDVRLEGIVWDGEKGSVAIINGEIVEEGQEIGSIKVLTIEKNSVIFDVDGDEVRIEINDD